MKSFIYTTFLSIILVSCASHRTPSSVDKSEQWASFSGGNVKAHVKFYAQGNKYCSDVVMSFVGLSEQYTQAKNWQVKASGDDHRPVNLKSRIPSSEVKVKRNFVVAPYGFYQTSELPISYCSSRPFNELVISANALPVGEDNQLKFESSFR